mmetsp:Transcript_39884/g.120444  ORF Transcript_39884/g.120444 Transcript_39884/m.120444 type:complete len:274 (+) Transcript_39884:289-1110(+)
MPWLPLLSGGRVRLYEEENGLHGAARGPAFPRQELPVQVRDPEGLRGPGGQAGEAAPSRRDGPDRPQDVLDRQAGPAGGDAERLVGELEEEGPEAGLEPEVLGLERGGRAQAHQRAQILRGEHDLHDSRAEQWRRCAAGARGPDRPAQEGLGRPGPGCSDGQNAHHKGRVGRARAASRVRRGHRAAELCGGEVLLRVLLPGVQRGGVPDLRQGQNGGGPRPLLPRGHQAAVPVSPRGCADRSRAAVRADSPGYVAAQAGSGTGIPPWAPSRSF